MDKRKSDITQTETVAYRERIVEMVEKIEKLGTLQYLHRFLELFLEKWG